MTTLQLFMVVALPITGMCYAILGAIKLPLAERLNMNEAKVGGLVSSFGLMVGPIILAAGFLTDALGRKGVIVGGALLVAVALFLLSQTRRYGIAILAVAMLSAGWAAMINVANVLMYLAFPESVFMATNILDGLFGFGAFVTPPLVALMLRKLGFSLGLSICGGAAVIPAVFAFFVQMEAAPAAADADPTAAAEAAVAGFGDLIADPIMWFLALSLMFWAPLESATAAWTTTFVTRLSPEGEDPARGKRLASLTLSGFWMGFMGSRLIAAAIYFQFDISEHTEIATARYLHIIIAILAGLAMAVLVFSRSRGLTIGAILFAGFIFGPFFPNLMALLLSHFPAAVHGRAVGVLFAGASIGWTIVPLIVGAVAKRTNIHRGFVVAVVDALLLLGVVIAHLVFVS